MLWYLLAITYKEIRKTVGSKLWSAKIKGFYTYTVSILGKVFILIDNYTHMGKCNIK